MYYTHNFGASQEYLGKAGIITPLYVTVQATAERLYSLREKLGKCLPVCILIEAVKINEEKTEKLKQTWLLVRY